MDLLALNNNVVFEVDGWTDEGGWAIMVKGASPNASPTRTNSPGLARLLCCRGFPP